MSTAGLKHPKTVKRGRTKADMDRAADRKGSEEVKKRSEGRCEVWEVVCGWPSSDGYLSSWRCERKAVHVMHLIGGRGKRGKGISALALHKLHGCAEHHREIDGDLGGRRLRRLGPMIPQYTDPYERVK